MIELALHMMDISENSFRAGATEVRWKVKADRIEDVLLLEVEDNGAGMDAETLERVLDPFYTTRTTRKVGMGIPLLKQHAELTGGELLLESKPGQGTSLAVSFVLSHPDLQPIGDLAGAWVLGAAMNEKVHMYLSCSSTDGSFEIDTQEIKDMLGVENLNDAELIDQLKRLIRNKLEEIKL